MKNPNRTDIMRLLEDYNADPDAWTDEQAEKIAEVAKAYGLDFDRENKAVRKFAFDTADTALLGLVPNEWRPESRGERTYGETGLDKFAGGAGTLAGIAGGGGAAWLGRKAIGAGVGRGLGYAQHYGTKAAKSGAEYAGRSYSTARELSGRGMAYGRKIYADGPSLARKAGEYGRRTRELGRESFRKGTSSLNRGTSTSYFGELRNNFNRGLNGAPSVRPSGNLLRMSGDSIGGYGGLV